MDNKKPDGAGGFKNLMDQALTKSEDRRLFNLPVKDEANGKGKSD